MVILSNTVKGRHVTSSDVTSLPSYYRKPQRIEILQGFQPASIHSKAQTNPHSSPQFMFLLSPVRLKNSSINASTTQLIVRNALLQKILLTHQTVTKETKTFYTRKGKQRIPKKNYEDKLNTIKGSRA